MQRAEHIRIRSQSQIARYPTLQIIKELPGSLEAGPHASPLMQASQRHGEVLWLSSSSKEKDSREIDQYRSKALLNVEGKIFFSVLARTITNFLLENGYVNTSFHGFHPTSSSTTPLAVFPHARQHQESGLKLF